MVFLNTSGSDAYSWRFGPSLLNQDNNNHEAQVQSPLLYSETVVHIREAIVQQESDKNAKLLNPSGSGAIGLGQVMPEDLPHWSQEALGREVSVQEFLDHPDLQIAIIDYKINQYWQQAIAQAHGNEDEAVMRVASWWYAGNPNLFANTKPQFWNGDEYPSIAEYCSQVLDRFKAQYRIRGST